MIETTDIIRVTKDYACKMHKISRQRYDNHPYEHHLRMVCEIASKFIDLIPFNDRFDIYAGCWAHDLIEDTGVTYNTVKLNTNETVAEYSYALTNEKGKNRAERANSKYYKGILEYKHASFIKLCDRIANVMYGKKINSKMFKMYQKEYEHFKNELYDGRWDDMWKYLEVLLKY